MFYRLKSFVAFFKTIIIIVIIVIIVIISIIILMINGLNLRARAILLSQKFTRAYLHQIALEILLLPIHLL